MRLFDTQHKTFWVTFLAVVSLCLVFKVALVHHDLAVRRTANTLRSILIMDPRFQQVEVWRTSHPKVILHGSVASAADLEGLHQIVEQAHVPCEPKFDVHVGKNPD